MRTFAQGQVQPQERISSGIARSKMATSGPFHHTLPIPPLQRTIINQTVGRFPLTNAKELTTGQTNTATITGFAHDFSRIPIHARTPLKIQPKLTVNTSGDIYEQEADRAAEEVMRMHEPRQQIACPSGGGCPKGQDGYGNHEHLRTKAVGSQSSAGTEAPPIVHKALRSQGQPLDSATRGFMESRFGYDFSQVRIHADNQSAVSARAINALAYTVGRDVWFSPEQYAPHTGVGRKLLAHELAHVVQQGQSAPLAANGALQPDTRPPVRAQAQTQPALMRQPRGPRRQQQRPRGQRRPRHSASELMSFARRPQFGLRRWRRLDATERAEVLRYSAQIYDANFAAQFQQAAESGRARGASGDLNFHPRAPLPGELEALQGAGYRFAQNMPDGATQVWVRPTGEEVWFQAPQQAGQPIAPPAPPPPPPPEHECEAICSAVTPSMNECLDCCNLTVPEPRTGHDQECFLDCIVGCEGLEPPPSPDP